MNLKAQISDTSEKKEAGKTTNAFDIIHQAAEDFVEKSKGKWRNTPGIKKSMTSGSSESQSGGTDTSVELPATLRGKLEESSNELPKDKEEYADSIKESGEKDLKDEALNAMRSCDISWTYTHRYGLGWKGAESKKVSPEYAYERYMHGDFPELRVDPEKRVIHVNEYSIHDME